MLFQLEGSQAVARAVALCRPKIVCAYPITPQTHIVEGLGELVRSKKLENCEYINVESEMAALSVAIGSEAAGVRSYTATSSQGLLYMMEAVYNASGLELPIVMTLGNRAIGSPINIWNDHTDAMSVRDSGWIMLFAETNQEAVDLHIQAFKIAEKAKCPVMVCVDGFILTHAYERVDLPSQKEVDEFLPDYEPHISLDTEHPTAIGTMVPPEYFMEVRYLAHKRQIDTLPVVECVGTQFKEKFGRKSGGLLHEYNLEKAETVIVTMGSVAGTIKDTVDELNANGSKLGVLSIVSYRPFPKEAIREALKNAKEVIVLEKAFAVGIGGILHQEIALALQDLGIAIHSVIAGLGGRAITSEMIREYFNNKKHDNMVFLGLKEDVIDREYRPIKNSECNNKF
ncbi:MAG: pyruvate ferredoxin oxidoreductase [Alphaproteobacteria bacterium]|nr:pyruvate ferredoxin oxidoreductase [Alphaproteobacteria bacterium]